MASTNKQNTASKKLPVNSEILKTNDITEPPDLLVTQRGNCFEKFADALGQHMTIHLAIKSLRTLLML